MWMEDLPRGVSVHDGGRDAARTILDVVRRQGVPVAAFVNSARFQPEDAGLLREWREAGAELGNHTASHVCIDAVAEADWQADVLACHHALVAAAAYPPRYFRFPYLRAGRTGERKRAALRFLSELGYTVAPVTAVTAEWLLAHYYRLALHAGARAMSERIAGRLVPHVSGAIEAAERLAHDRAGRAIPQIVLLHVNPLTARCIDELIVMLGRRYQLIALDDALRDPVFATPGRHAGTPRPSQPARSANDDVLREFQSEFGWPPAPAMPGRR